MSETQFVIAKCPGCGAIEFADLSPDHETENEIEQLKGQGLLIEWHAREELETLRPTLGSCECGEPEDRIAGLQDQLTVLTRQLAERDAEIRKWIEGVRDVFGLHKPGDDGWNGYAKAIKDLERFLDTRASTQPPEPAGEGGV